MDDEPFQTLLEQVQDLHRRTDELNRSKARVCPREHPSATQLADSVEPSSRSEDLADEVVEALSTPRLSSVQSRQLWRAYFGT